MSLESPVVSSTFHPTAGLDDSRPPDIQLLSSDNVLFHAHARVLSRISRNAFGGVLAPRRPPGPAHVSEDHTTLHAILLAVYNLQFAPFNPDLSILGTAISALLGKYGVPVASPVFAPTSALGVAILAHARTRPVDVYALAAMHNIRTLTSPASEYLLSFDLSTLPEDAAERMGSFWLVRLWALHETRNKTLKALLAIPPAKHPLMPGCSAAIQQAIARAWIITTADIIWKTSPGVNASALEAALQTVAADCPCTVCVENVNRRIQNITTQWAAVKRTIDI